MYVCTFTGVLPWSAVYIQVSQLGINTIQEDNSQLVTHLHTAPSSFFQISASFSQISVSLDALHSFSLYPPIPLFSSCIDVPLPRGHPVPHIQHDITKAD